MTIVLTGGGSGGHITPLLAVAAELKKLDPSATIVCIGQRGDGLGDLLAADKNIDAVHVVSAGKFRRYHGESILRQLLDIPTVLKNIRDVYRTLAGIVQSWLLLGRLRPDVIFVKGGFVGVPVGLAAAARHIPFVTHDSDAIPGLANRIIARWASLHAVGQPKEAYAYPPAKTVYVGVPVAREFQEVTEAQQAAYKQELGIAKNAQMLFVIGGGLGAQRVNRAVAEAAPTLLHANSKLVLVHAVGRANKAEMDARYAKVISKADQARVIVKDFLPDVYRYGGAADVVITRAGATNMAEFAVQGKPCIVVPNPQLAGGHQVKNARVLERRGAVIVLSERELLDDPHALGAAVTKLLRDPVKRKQLGKALHDLGKPDAARELAMVLLEQATNNQKPA